MCLIKVHIDYTGGKRMRQQLLAHLLVLLLPLVSKKSRLLRPVKILQIVECVKTLSKIIHTGLDIVIMQGIS